MLVLERSETITACSRKPDFVTATGRVISLKPVLKVKVPGCQCSRPAGAPHCPVGEDEAHAQSYHMRFVSFM